MKRLRIARKILKFTGVNKIVLSLFIFMAISGLILMFVEPGVHTYGDGLWLCFSVVTSIGFGDVSAVTHIGRILCMLLGFYGIFVIALIPGVVVNFFLEFSKIKYNESVVTLLDELERLPELPKEDLIRISESVKKKNRNL